MKATLIILALVINSSLPVVMAAETSKIKLSSSQEAFNSKWNFSPLLIKKEEDTTVHTKIFKRLIWIGKTPVPVVDTNFVYLENPKKNSDPKKNELNYIAQSIKKSFGSEMKVSGNAAEMNVEGKFEKINRYIKVSLQKKNNHIIIITSFARMGLYPKLKAEVEELHSVLSDYNGKVEKVKKTTWQKWNPIIDDVYADPGGLNLNNLISGMNTSTSSLGSTFNIDVNTSGVENSLNGLNDNVGSLNTNLTDANSNWGNTNGQLGNANTNWNNTNGQLGNANTNWNNTNVQIGNANTNWDNTNKQVADANKNWDNTNKQVADANKNWDNTNKQIDGANKNWADTNDEIAKANESMKDLNTNWAESNKILAKAMDPNHMAKVAFYTAAGAALGGIAVNLAVQGVSEGISILHELFTGAKKKKLEWEDFEKAMQVWDNQLNDLVKMEQVVDNYLSAFNFFEGKNIGNDYVKQLNTSVRDMKFDRDLYLEKFKDQNLDIACRKLYYDAADELDQKVKEYDKIIVFATNNSMSINSGAGYFCNQLKELQRKILSAETQMQDLRLKILVAENQYYGKQTDALEKRDEDMEKINDKLAKTLKEKKAYDKVVLERAAEAHKETRANWLAQCMDGKNEEGLMIKEQLSKTFFLFRYFKKRSSCQESFAKVGEALKKRDEEAVKRMLADETLRKDLVVKANNTVELQLSAEQMAWMSRLHMDAYCYQFAHGPESEVPAKCRDFPELLYSMSLSKGSEKAKKAYENKCEGRYLDGLKSLAKAQ